MLVRRGVQQAAEDPGERQHVVDLVRVVRAAGGHHGGVLAGHRRVDLGDRVGQREDDRRPRPSRRRRRRRGRSGAETPMKTSAPTIASCRVPVRPVVVGRVGAAQCSDSCSPAPVAVDDAVDVGDDDVLRAGREQQPQDRRTGRARRRTSRSRTSREVLADHPQRVGQRGEHHDRGAVLVVVEDRDVEDLAQPGLDLEAAGRGDVLEVDAGEARRRRPGRSRRSRRGPGCPGTAARRRCRRTA